MLKLRFIGLPMTLLTSFAAGTSCQC